MRAVVQRVSRAEVRVNGVANGHIGCGLVVLLGIAVDDTPEDADWLIRKILGQKIFDDTDGRMNLDVLAAGGGLLVVSQFTLFASTRKGTRPSWHRAAPPPVAIPLYEEFVQRMEAASGIPIATGEFGAAMVVDLANDGPVTLILDSRAKE